MSIPIGGIIMFHGAIADRPTSFNICDGGTYDTYITPNLVDRFVYGADEDDSVDNRGGSETHLHSNPNTSTSSTHRHSSGQITITGTTIEIVQGTPASVSAYNHTHIISSVYSSYSGAHSHAVPNTSSVSNLPPYIKAYFVMNTANNDIDLTDLPVGAIVAKSDDEIPKNWQLADGTNGTLDLRNRFVYGAEADDDVGDTGGATEHTHTNANTSDGGAHSHSALTTAAAASDAVTAETGSDPLFRQVAQSFHVHNNVTVAFDAIANHTHSLADLDNATNVPRHIKLYFIEKTA